MDTFIDDEISKKYSYTWWANILTAGRYGAKNDVSASFSEAAFFGYATPHKTLIINTAHYRDDRKTSNMQYTTQCCDSIENTTMILSLSL